MTLPNFRNILSNERKLTQDWASSWFKKTWMPFVLLILFLISNWFRQLQGLIWQSTTPRINLEYYLLRKFSLSVLTH